MSGDGFSLAVFGQRVKKRRAGLGWSLRDLGAKAGVAFNTISRLERGTGDIWLTHAVKIAAALGASLPELLAEPVCGRCDGRPPAGFTCNDCGRNASDAACPVCGHPCDDGHLAAAPGGYCAYCPGSKCQPDLLGPENTRALAAAGRGHFWAAGEGAAQ